LDWIASDSGEESGASLGFYAAVDREIFGERSSENIDQFAAITLERNLSSYLEYVAFVLAAFSCNLAWTEDQLLRYSGVARKFEKEIFTRRDAQLGSWSLSLRQMIEKFPIIQLSREIYAPGTLCHACNRKGTSLVEACLSGNFYDPKNFHGFQTANLVPASRKAAQEFSVSRQRPGGASEFVSLSGHCAKKIENYHKLHHWKWRIFSAVYQWLLGNRKAFDTANEAAEVIKNDTAFLERIKTLHNTLVGSREQIQFSD
jgi:hypothetical protein